MKYRNVTAFIFLSTLVLVLTYQSSARRPQRPKVTSLSASVDKDGPHPDKAEITGAVPIMCISAMSDDPHSSTPSCRITAPGFSGTVEPGKTVDATDAGTVTLSCNGQGWVRCHARIN